MQAESFLKSIAACYLQPPPGSLGGRAADKGPVTRHSQVYVCEGVGWTRDGTPHQTWPSSARTSSCLVVAALPRPKVYNSQGTLSSHLSRWLHSHLCSVFSGWPHSFFPLHLKHLPVLMPLSPLPRSLLHLVTGLLPPWPSHFGCQTPPLLTISLSSLNLQQLPSASEGFKIQGPQPLVSLSPLSLSCSLSQTFYPSTQPPYCSLPFSSQALVHAVSLPGRPFSRPHLFMSNSILFSRAGLNVPSLLKSSIIYPN